MFFHTAIIARQLFLDFGEKISMSRPSFFGSTIRVSKTVLSRSTKLKLTRSCSYLGPVVNLADFGTLLSREWWSLPDVYLAHRANIICCLRRHGAGVTVVTARRLALPGAV